MQRKGLQYVDY